MKCWVDGCESPGYRDHPRCVFHDRQLSLGRMTMDAAAPHCPVCGITMREPAEACGFCVLEAPGVAA